MALVVHSPYFAAKYQLGQLHDLILEHSELKWLSKSPSLIFLFLYFAHTRIVQPSIVQQRPNDALFCALMFNQLGEYDVSNMFATAMYNYVTHELIPQRDVKMCLQFFNLLEELLISNNQYDLLHTLHRHVQHSLMHLHIMEPELMNMVSAPLMLEYVKHGILPTSEYELFTECISWAKHKATETIPIISIIRNLLPFIRFENMSMEEIFNVYNSTVFELLEWKDIFIAVQEAQRGESFAMFGHIYEHARKKRFVPTKPHAMLKKASYFIRQTLDQIKKEGYAVSEPFSAYTCDWRFSMHVNDNYMSVILWNATIADGIELKEPLTLRVSIVLQNMDESKHKRSQTIRTFAQTSNIMFERFIDLYKLGDEQFGFVQNHAFTLQVVLALVDETEEEEQLHVAD